VEHRDQYSPFRGDSETNVRRLTQRFQRSCQRKNEKVGDRDGRTVSADGGDCFCEPVHAHVPPDGKVGPSAMTH